MPRLTPLRLAPAALALAFAPLVAAQDAPLEGSLATAPELAVTAPAKPSAPAPEAALSQEALSQEAVSALLAEVAALNARVADLEARPLPASSPFKFSTELFASYGQGSEDETGTFALDRLRLTAKGAEGALGFRATTEVVQGDGRADLRMAYAYAEYKPAAWLGFRGGLIDAGWTNAVDKRWGYRPMGKVMTDQQKLIGYADMGVSATAKLPSKLGQVSVRALGGTGKKQIEVDGLDYVAAHALVSPFQTGALKGVTVGVHAFGSVKRDETSRRWGALVGYDAPAFAVNVNAEARQDSSVAGHGFSAFGELRLGALGVPAPLALVGMAETFTPDASQAEAVRTRTLGGLAYQATEQIQVILGYERTEKGGHAERRATLHFVAHL